MAFRNVAFRTRCNSLVSGRQRTAFVTYTEALGTPASDSASLSRRPDFPTKGLSSITSCAPGASPTITRLAWFMHPPRTTGRSFRGHSAHRARGAFGSISGFSACHPFIMSSRVRRPRRACETLGGARSSSSHPHVLRLAGTWGAWNGRPLPADDRVYTPHKAIRWADHMIDHLAQLQAFRRRASPDRWQASYMTTPADLAPFTADLESTRPFYTSVPACGPRSIGRPQS